MPQLKSMFLGPILLFGAALFSIGLPTMAETTTANVQGTSNDTKPDDPILLNQIQLIGSHNSFKKSIDSTLLFILDLFDSNLAAGLDYSHLPLTDQLQLGLRSLELDVYYDPNGGLYSEPFGSGLGPFSSDYDDDEIMKNSGFKVLHVQDIDYRSHCLTLRKCLEQIRHWSNENPQHIPLIITMNPKDQVIDQTGFEPPFAFSVDAWESLDAELTEMLSKHIVTPDDIRGSHRTLKESILAGWPTVDSLRGKILFVLDAPESKSLDYVADHPELTGRVMFVNLPEESSMASFRIVNDPVSDLDYIKSLVSTGFIVRTRADENTIESRTGDNTRLKAAINSGAQVIATDYYQMDTRHGTSFEVKLREQRLFRCNDLLMADTCRLQE
ncbi:MAG: hypothetical protein ACI9R8_002059 [Candidatus Paceibacteria bacterium]|jgi:hypothetical protein